jgi:hypothetical protein
VVKVCEHTFEAEDPAHPGYSVTEVDLFPAVGDTGEAYSMRHNKDSELYEIFNYEAEEPYTDEAVIFDGRLEETIDEANRLEERATGRASFEYGHQPRLHDCGEEFLEP